MVGSEEGGEKREKERRKGEKGERQRVSPMST